MYINKYIYIYIHCILYNMFSPFCFSQFGPGPRRSVRACAPSARHQQPLAAVLRFVVRHPKSRRGGHPGELRNATGGGRPQAPWDGPWDGSSHL